MRRAAVIAICTLAVATPAKAPGAPASPAQRLELGAPAYVGAARGPQSSSSPEDPTPNSQLAELRGSDTVVDDYFASSVAVSGATVVAGAWGHGSAAGRVYVFSKSPKGWHQAAQLLAPHPLPGDWFGAAVAVFGPTVVVGAPGYGSRSGRAYVFTETSTGWHLVAELAAPDPAANDVFGASVGVSQTTIVVGAWGRASNAGRAYVFTGTSTGWHLVAELVGPDTVADDWFGSSVAISGNTIVVGAAGHAANAGRVYIFRKSAIGWHQAAELKGSDTVANDLFGGSVGVSGAIVVIGAWGHASNAGRAYVFDGTTTGWHQAAELKGSDTVPGDGFGWSVALSGPDIAVGAWHSASLAGRAYAFMSSAVGWRQTGELMGSDTVPGDLFGYSVAVSDAFIVVGGPSHVSNAGRAYVFKV